MKGRILMAKRQPVAELPSDPFLDIIEASSVFLVSLAHLRDLVEEKTELDADMAEAVASDLSNMRRWLAETEPSMLVTVALPGILPTHGIEPLKMAGVYHSSAIDAVIHVASNVCHIVEQSAGRSDGDFDPARLATRWRMIAGRLRPILGSFRDQDEVQQILMRINQELSWATEAWADKQPVAPARKGLGIMALAAAGWIGEDCPQNLLDLLSFLKPRAGWLHAWNADQPLCPEFVEDIVTRVWSAAPIPTDPVERNAWAKEQVLRWTNIVLSNVNGWFDAYDFSGYPVWTTDFQDPLDLQRADHHFSALIAWCKSKTWQGEAKGEEGAATQTTRWEGLKKWAHNNRVIVILFAIALVIGIVAAAITSLETIGNAIGRAIEWWLRPKR
jgi:hypothetical protein